MTPPSIDFHCHLDLYPEPMEAVRRCIEMRAYVLSVTTTPKAWQGTKSLVPQGSRVQTALGFHPQIVHERLGELPLFEQLLPEVKYVGEVGLDGSPELKPHWTVQTQVFEHILLLCERAGGRIMTIHSRRAASAVIDQLAKYPNAGTPVLHWFTGTRAELARAIDIGCWFSVGPAMFESRRGRELISAMPQNRVLTETDGPFAKVADRPLLPAETHQAVVGLSEIWNISLSKVEEALLGSLRKLTS